MTGLLAEPDCGLDRLLRRLHGSPEAEAFQAAVLGALEAHDRQYGADFIPTLEAYFAAGASAKQTASRLRLHRNTVLYRLQRIAEISGHRLDDPSTCLNLQVALRLRHTRLAAARHATPTSIGERAGTPGKPATPAGAGAPETGSGSGQGGGRALG
ncbi:MAG: helix-turn-helix domain-containing protein [Chloroflexi bacterium]|nr:helix-turn-helix domain-containing protein [Chloroflexota bacterium]